MSINELKEGNVFVTTIEDNHIKEIKIKSITGENINVDIISCKCEDTTGKKMNIDMRLRRLKTRFKLKDNKIRKL